MADGYDEHLSLLRIADEECFDICTLQSGLNSFHAKNPFRMEIGG